MPGEQHYTPCIEDIDPMKCIGYSNVIVHCGINNIKNSGCNVEECAEKLINKVETIRSVCPKSKITINPVLPTKSDLLNARAKQFNGKNFQYINTRYDTLLSYVHFNVFLDERTLLLKEELGRFNNRYDLLHLGSSGIKLLANIVKQRVCGSIVDGRSYAGVQSGRVNSMNGVRVQNEERRSDSVNRVGCESMMAAPITTSSEFPALSQQTES